MVIDGYMWTRIPGTDVEIRALADRPLARVTGRGHDPPKFPVPCGRDARSGTVTESRVTSAWVFY
jgi:hypothetical protein